MRCPKSVTVLRRSLNAELSVIGTRHALTVVFLLPELHFVLFVALVLLTCIELPAEIPAIIAQSITPFCSYVFDFPFLCTVCCIHSLIHLVDFCVVTQIMKITLKSDPVLEKCLWCLIVRCLLPILSGCFLSCYASSG